MTINNVVSFFLIQEFDYMGAKSDAEEKLRELLVMIRGDRSAVV